MEKDFNTNLLRLMEILYDSGDQPNRGLAWGVMENV
jgi:hypothetical protein